MMPVPVEGRFGIDRAQNPVEHFGDNGSYHTAVELRDFARPLRLVACLTPVRSAENSGISGAMRQLPSATARASPSRPTPPPRSGSSPHGPSTTTPPVPIPRWPCACAPGSDQRST
jgi:hypothetical protein